MGTYVELCNKFPEMKAAVEAKGGTVTVANANPSPDEIIAGIGTIEEAKPDMLQGIVDSIATDPLYNLFYNSQATKIDISNLDISGCTTMGSMFDNAQKVVSIKLGDIDTSNITNMMSMFYNCYALKELDVSKLNTSAVTTMQNMFSGCRVLPSIDVSNFDMRNVTNVNAMFSGCRAITTIDISNWGRIQGDAYGPFDHLFSSCNKLRTIQGDLDLYYAEGQTIMYILRDAYAIESVTVKNIRTRMLFLGSGTSYGHLLSLASLINAIKELWDYSTDASSHTLGIGSANITKIKSIYVKLVDVTDEMIAADEFAANKLPCVECASTDEGAMTLTAYAGLKNWELA